jgi:Co/Zn/Cd efflux system component
MVISELASHTALVGAIVYALTEAIERAGVPKHLLPSVALVIGTLAGLAFGWYLGEDLLLSAVSGLIVGSGTVGADQAAKHVKELMEITHGSKKAE